MLNKGLEKVKISSERKIQDVNTDDFRIKLMAELLKRVVAADGVFTESMRKGQGKTETDPLQH